MSSLSTSTETCLSKGVIQSNLNAGVLPPNERAVFKVLGLKTLNPNGGNNESNVKVRLAISDGQDKFVKALLIFPRENPPVLPKKDDIVDLRNPIGQNPTNAVTTVNGSHVFLVHNFRILDKEAVIRLTQSTVSVDTPSTPSSTASSSSNNVAPPTPAKRPGSPLASGSNDPRPNPAKRNLFDRPRSAAMPLAKTTHRIEDLNPYQNKYTICARVTSIEPIKEISNSRWSGSVFSVVFEDESGDIKASGFNVRNDYNMYELVKDRLLLTKAQ